MAKDNNIQVAGNLTDNFRGYAALLRGTTDTAGIFDTRAI